MCTPRLTCAFCGIEFGPKRSATERTSEHAIAQWLDPFMPNPGESVKHTVRQGLSGAVLTEWDSATVSLIAKRVCKRCNGGWMNVNENAARRYLETLLKGHRTRLYREGQTALSAWAVKTALALDLVSHDDPPVATEHYRAMSRSRLVPPPGTQVFLSLYRGWRHGFYRPRALRVTSDSGEEHRAYVASLTVHYAAFQVFFNDHPQELILGKRSPWKERTPQIWPVVSDVDWPPRIGVTEETLNAFSDPFPTDGRRTATGTR